MFTRRSGLLFVVSAFLFGGTFVAAKAGLAHLPPLLFVAIRFDIGAVVLGLFAATRLSWADVRPRTTGDILGIAATGLVVVGLTNALLFVGQQYVTSGVAAVVFSLNPILTPVFGALLLSEDGLPSRAAAGMFLGVIGVALVANPDPSAVFESASGVALLFGAAVTSALGAVMIRRAGATLSSTAQTVWGVPLAAGLLHVLSLTAGESAASVSLPPVALVSLIYVGVGSGAIAYLTYFALIDEVGATRANLLFYFVPVVSAIGGWALLGETVPPVSLFGFLVIFAGFLLIAGFSPKLVEYARRAVGDRAAEGAR